MWLTVAFWPLWTWLVLVIMRPSALSMLALWSITLITLRNNQLKKDNYSMLHSLLYFRLVWLRSGKRPSVYKYSPPYISLLLIIIKILMKLILTASMLLALFPTSLGIILNLLMISGSILNMHFQDSDNHISSRQQSHASAISPPTMAQALALASLQ